MIAKSPTPDVQVEFSDHEVLVRRADRRYRVRGLAKNTSYDQLKINLMVSRDSLIHVDTLDLYDARRRITFCKQAAAELFIAELRKIHDKTHPAKTRPEAGDRRPEEKDEGDLTAVPAS